MVADALPKTAGSWSITDLKAWLTISYADLLQLSQSNTFPAWVLSIIQSLLRQSGFTDLLIDLSHVHVDYGLNEIPSAGASVAVGRRLDNSTLLSAIHYITKRLKLFVACSVWCSGKVTSSSGPVVDAWPLPNADGSPKPFRIMNGYIVNTDFKKTNRGVEYNLAITHWLADLNFSSMTSRSSSANNSEQLSYDAAQPIYPNGGQLGSATTGSGASLTQAGPLFNTATLLTDMWGNNDKILAPSTLPQDITLAFGGLKQWLVELSLQDRLNWNAIQTGLCGGETNNTSGKKNVEALAALGRFEPFENGYIDGVPLKMSQRPGMDNLANMIGTTFGKETPEMMSGFTMWDKLIKWGSDFQFAIVPQVEKALIVPFAPFLKRSWATIFANDYDYYEQSDNVPRPLRGVGLTIGRGFLAGGTLGLNSQPAYNTVGAYYENPARRNGITIWKYAPLWLTGVVIPHGDPLFDASNVISNAMTAGIGLVPNQKPPNKKFKDIAPFWCDYARALYSQEILRNRSAKISGRLRFDIAPGSIVRIEEPEEDFILKALMPVDPTRTYNWAQVIRVSCVLDAEAQKAGTAFQVAFVRDYDENFDDSYTLDKHPIWSCNWYGAPLVNDEAFYPGGAKPGITPPECSQQTLIDILPVPDLPTAFA